MYRIVVRRLRWPASSFTVAAGNLARLSANGNGFDQDELKDDVADLGDTLTNTSPRRPS
jgi:hypothetical protein